LCNNCSDKGKDLISHSFPKDQILRKTWEIKIKRGEFVETDYRKSLTGARQDLVKNAVPSIFTWSYCDNEASQRSERARIRRNKASKPFASPLYMETKSTSGKFEAMTTSKNNPQETDLDSKTQERELLRFLI